MGNTSSKVKNKWNAEHYTRLTIMLDKEEAEAYKNKCKAEGLSFSDVPKEAIKNFLNKK